MEDSQIIELYWQRSENAIAETSKKYGKLCRHIAMNIIGNFSDAEECENDTYVAVWNAIPPTRPQIFSAFISKIARNIALNRYEYNKAQKRNNQFDMVLSELEECLACKQTVEDAVEEKEVASVLDGFLEGLSKEKRVIFVRRYWYSDSVKEIAKRMQISESKVKTVLFRTRKELQEYLLQHGVTV
ncbi:MAG: sigma-70 family RNA polymerase sigma factor [Lachnospiraceae bacterium]|nr:sigma-70 family RNA polymerase sigma factor [Lachnospiraceae bacterium]